MFQPLSPPTGMVHEIRWLEICPWLILVKALRVSLLLRVILLAFFGVLTTQWGWSVLNEGLARNPVQFERLSDVPTLPSLQQSTAANGDNPNGQASLVTTTLGPLIRPWHWLSQPFLHASHQQISWDQLLSLMACGAWAVAVWGIFGGAIARTSALHLTRGETIGPITALRSAASKWHHTVGAPLIALLGAIALAVPVILVGVLIRFDFLALATGFGWVFLLAWGFLLAVVLLGLLIGWPLMWATIGVERSDAFDGASRCYAYVYQKPMELAFYVLIASLLGLLGETVVYYFSHAAVAVTEWMVSWGAGNERAQQLIMTTPNGAEAAALTGIAATAGRAIQFWNWTLFAGAASFPVAHLWTSAVGIYLVMRRHVDAAEMEEVQLENGEPNSFPASSETIEAEASDSSTPDETP